MLANPQKHYLSDTSQLHIINEFNIVVMLKQKVIVARNMIEKCFKTKQVGNSKDHLPLNINPTKKHSRNNGEELGIYSEDEKIIKNNLNKYIYNSKVIHHDKIQSSSFTSSIYSLLKQNNQESLEKELRKKSDTSLQHNVTENRERASQNFINCIQGKICVKVIAFTKNTT